MYPLNLIRTRQRDYCRAPCCRVGVTLAESAVVLPVVILVLFALLDLGLAALRYNSLAEATRLIARETIIHGSLAPSELGTWGPEEFEGTAADESAIVDAVKNHLPTMSSSQVSVRVTWPDNGNSPRDPVQVELSYLHKPLIPTLFAWGPLDLRSVATMNIVN